MTTTQETTYIRVLQCWDCRSMEELPDYEGLPDHDVILHYVDDKHGGHTEQPHARAIHRVEKRFWDDRSVRKQIVDQMWKNQTGFVPEYYHARDTMQEDAAKCFAKHKRQIPCIDYQDPSKRIGNPGAGLRRWIAKETRRDDIGPGPKLYLCNFCPVQTRVDAIKALNN